MVGKAMAVLELFNTSRRQMGVVEIGELLGRPRSTVSRWLAVMEEVGWLDRDGDTGPYRLGIRLAALGELARHSTSLQIAARPFLEELTRVTRETASVNELLGSDVVNVGVVESPRPILQAGGVGIPLPLHATAAGKVLTAWRPKDEVLRLLPPRLEQLTPRTIADVDRFLDELHQVRADGHAIALGELAEDLIAISAPVRDQTGQVVGAITVGGPISRFDDERRNEVVARVMAAGSGVSKALGYMDERGHVGDGAGPSRRVA
jgi:DNA-binding IclR family transcriptional regulator